MIEKMVKVSQYYVHAGSSAINVLMKFGINPLLATILSAIAGTLVIIGLFSLFKEHSLLFLFAVASVIGRLWTYHLGYDNVMLVFLLLSIIELNFKKPNKFNVLALILLYLTLSVRSRLEYFSPHVSAIQSIIWVGCLLYILIYQKEFKDTDSPGTNGLDIHPLKIDS